MVVHFLYPNRCVFPLKAGGIFKEHNTSVFFQSLYILLLKIRSLEMQVLSQSLS